MCKHFVTVELKNSHNSELVFVLTSGEIRPVLLFLILIARFIILLCSQSASRNVFHL